MTKYDKMKNLVKSNPIFQFAEKAIEQEPILLSDAFSPTGISFGLGQSLMLDRNKEHLSSVKRQRLLFNMMKFNMKKRS
jgi:hypothetical protein